MSEVKVNKLSPRSGTTVTLGDSGDTFTVPSGVTFDASSGSLAGTLTTAAQPNITSVGTLTSFASTGIDDNATSTAVTIDSDENVGINITSGLQAKLHIVKNDAGALNDANSNMLMIENTTATGISIGSATTGEGHIYFSDSGDADVGAMSYFHTDNSLRFRANAAERMRINSSGNVGIGTTSPSEVLHVVGDILATGGDFKSDANNYLGFSNDTFARFVVNDTEVFRVLSSGNVGIGNSAPSVSLSVGDDNDGSQGVVGKKALISQTLATVYAGGTSGSWGGLMLNNNDSTSNRTATGLHFTHGTSGVAAIQSTSAASQRADLRFITRGAGDTVAERMRIDDDGNLLLNTTSQVFAGKMNLAYSRTTHDGFGIDCDSTSTGIAIKFKNPNGAVGQISTSGSSTTYSTSSDHRLKENVSYDFDATSRLKQLKPARFNFIADADTTVDGFLAHEVSSVVPEAITGTKDAVNEDGSIKPQGIDQSKLVPLLVKTIQELEARITTLEANNP